MHTEKILQREKLLLILFIVLVLFGGKKLPELARSIGLGMREFKNALNGIDEPNQQENKRHNESEEPITVEVESEDSNLK